MTGPRQWRNVAVQSVVVALLGLVAAGAGQAAGQSPSASPSASGETPASPQASGAPQAPAAGPGVPVMFRGRELFRLYASFGSLTAEERAELVSRRLAILSRDFRFDPAKVRVVHRENLSEFVSGDTVIGVVSDADAAAVRRDRREFAELVWQAVQRTVLETREEFTWKSVARGAAWSAVATLGLVVVLWGLRRSSRGARRLARRLAGRYIPGVRVQKAEIVSAARIAELLASAVRLSALVAGVLAVFVWAEVVASLLPWTSPYARALYGYITQPFALIWDAFVGYLPSIFFLLVIALVTRMALNAVRFFFDEIAGERIRFENFPAEWADPTYKIVRVLLIVLALVAAFPYIPGSASPAFQGISLFVGFVISLSSSSAISNVIAGTILTYTGAFRVGDRVKVGDTVGDVVKKTLLVTHVRTIKNVVVSIPNSLVINSPVVNYATLAAERGLILHTAITIGYDAPWRTIHELMIAAALATPGIERQPAPFVWQTSLNDFYVTYEINAFTREPHRMMEIYAELHANIQDKFFEAGVEIMSPHYYSLRDGNRTAIPDAFLPEGYEPPGFKVR